MEKSTTPEDRITKSWQMKSTVASLGLIVFVLVIGFLLYTNLEAGFNAMGENERKNAFDYSRCGPSLSGVFQPSTLNQLCP